MQTTTKQKLEVDVSEEPNWLHEGKTNKSKKDKISQFGKKALRRKKK